MAGYGYGYPNHPFLPNNHQQPPLPHPQPSAPYGHNMLKYYTSNHSFSFPTSHPVPSVPMKNNNNNNSSSNLFYKTRHCKKYRETGECPYGKSCIFAHGDEELRKPPGNLGLCHKFLRDGYCPYWNTCTYLHQHHHQAPPSSMTGDSRQTDVAPTEVENMGDDGDLENDKRNVENMGGADHVENDQRNIIAEETRRILPNSTVRSGMDLYATPRNEENNNERNKDEERNKRFPGGKIDTIYADWIY